MVKSLASSLTNQITFPLLFKIAQSVTGHSDHLVIGKSKAVQKQKLLLGENRCCQFTNGMLVSLRWESRFCLINQSVYNCSRRVQQCILLVPIKLVLSYEGLHPGKKSKVGHSVCPCVCRGLNTLSSGLTCFWLTKLPNWKRKEGRSPQQFRAI